MEAAIDGATIISGIVVLLLGVLGVLLKMWMNTQKEGQEQLRADNKEVLKQLASNFREFTKSNEHALELIQENRTQVLLVQQAQKTHVDYTETRFEAGMTKIAANTEAITRIKKS